MKIKLISIPVLDQAKALEFYTQILGFEKKHDIPLGGGNRWLTVISPEDRDGPEILLEPAPLHFKPSKVYQEALFEAGMPCAQLDVDNLDGQFDRLQRLGVEFSKQPTNVGTAKIAIFNDTCGNKIQLLQML